MAAFLLAEAKKYRHRISVFIGRGKESRYQMTITPKKNGARRAIRNSMLAVAVAAMTIATTGCNKLRARDQLNKGVQAYKASHFEEAVDHFQKATALDPSLDVARLYLATAYVAQYVPGSDVKENLDMANGAIDQFKQVLESQKNDRSVQVLATKGLGSLYFNMKQFDKAKEYDKKAIDLDPNDPENYYSVAVIDWTQSYVPRQEERNKLCLKPTDPLKDPKVCAKVHDMNWDRVQDGITMLQKAIDLRKDYDDAMAYLNLMYRERADIQCDDPSARDADLKTADDWVDKTMATKKAKAEKAAEKAGGGIVLDPK